VLPPGRFNHALSRLFIINVLVFATENTFPLFIWCIRFFSLLGRYRVVAWTSDQSAGDAGRRVGVYVCVTDTRDVTTVTKGGVDVKLLCNRAFDMQSVTFVVPDNNNNNNNNKGDGDDDSDDGTLRGSGGGLVKLRFKSRATPLPMRVHCYICAEVSGGNADFDFVDAADDTTAAVAAKEAASKLDATAVDDNEDAIGGEGDEKEEDVESAAADAALRRRCPITRVRGGDAPLFNRLSLLAYTPSVGSRKCSCDVPLTFLHSAAHAKSHDRYATLHTHTADTRRAAAGVACGG
jgi:hypothetical protein